MNIRWYIIIFIFTFTLFSVGSYSLTRAYFTDTVVSINHTFTTAESFNSNESQNPEISPEESESTSSGKIVINEVSPEGGSDKDWIEIYNGTNSIIDLTGWTIEDNSGFEIIPGSHILPSMSYAVIVAKDHAVEDIPASTLTIELLTSAIGGQSGLAVGGDKVVLKNAENSIVDQVSWGDNNESLDPPALKPGVGNSLYRIPNGVDTGTADDWKVGTSSLGIENN